MNIQEFKSIVDDAAKNGSTAILPNSSVEKAVIVLTNIFKYSNESIKIFANQCESPICQSEEYTEELKNAVISRDVNVKILFTKEPIPSSKAFLMIQNLAFQYPSKVHYEIMSSGAQEEISNANYNNGRDFHFAVADKKMYRYETDVEKYSAFFCFNDVERARKLEDIFDTAFNLSTH